LGGLCLRLSLVFSALWPATRAFARFCPDWFLAETVTEQLNKPSDVIDIGSRRQMKLCKECSEPAVKSFVIGTGSNSQLDLCYAHAAEASLLELPLESIAAIADEIDNRAVCHDILEFSARVLAT
jgi:hypothetical protein